MTTLHVTKGSGDVQVLLTEIEVGAPQVLQFVWSTDVAGAAGGAWQIRLTSTGSSGPLLVASGKTSPAPGVGGQALFSIAADAFLKPAPPGPPGVKYSVTITPVDAMNQPLGSASPAVVVTQQAATPQGPISFGPSAVFPDLELVHYAEQFGQVPETQILFGLATVTIRAVNQGKDKTDPMTVSVTDFNGLMQQQGPGAAVDGLNPGDSWPDFTLNMAVVLPPPTSQLGQEEQFFMWRQRYNAANGVDLRGVMDWRGPQATPLGSHSEVGLYKGFGDSTPCQEGSNTIENAPPEKAVCDGALCLPLAEVVRSIKQRLDCRVVGYAGKVGQFPNLVPFEGGSARPIASVSKFVTTLATIKVLAKQFPRESLDASLNTPIGPYLAKVKDWAVVPAVAAITFKELLAHRSGIKDYGNTGQNLEGLRQFFTRPFNPNSTTKCGDPVLDPNDAFAPNVVVPEKWTAPRLELTKEWCYSNYNFSILRVLLPMIEGPEGTDEASLANQYVKIVKENVFDPVGVTDADCSPPPGSSTYAYAYAFPGSLPGYDWKSLALVSGANGWYLSVDDILKVLISLNQGDGKVLTTEQFAAMESLPGGHGLGWDYLNLGNGAYRCLQKNGGLSSWNGTSISTEILIFGPSSPGPAFLGVLFMNSDLTREAVGADTVLTQALLSAVRSQP
jgi:CubicO group peptidase (beta-lactamase class C family)